MPWHALVTAVVPRVREALGVLVREDRAVRLHRRERRQVLYARQRTEFVIVVGAPTSLAMSSKPENCRHVSLSMMFCTSGSLSASGVYRTLFCSSNTEGSGLGHPSQLRPEGTHVVGGGGHCSSSRSNPEWSKVGDRAKGVAETEHGDRSVEKNVGSYNRTGAPGIAARPNYSVTLRTAPTISCL